MPVITNVATRTMGSTLNKTKSGAETVDLKIANLTSIGEIGVESEEIDCTDLDSPNNYKEFIAGTKDAGEVSIAGNIKDESNIEKMLALAESQTVETWTVVYPSKAKWEFKAFVKSFKDGEKTPDGLATFTANLRISGKPIYTKSV
ncbi:MAG: phage tail tube protein [Bacilli bacterium]